MVKLKVVGKQLAKNERQHDVMIVTCAGVACDGLGQDESAAPPAPQAHFQAQMTLAEAKKYDLGDEFVLREV